MLGTQIGFTSMRIVGSPEANSGAKFDRKLPALACNERVRVHTMLIIGARDMEAGAVSVRLHHVCPQGAKPKAEAVADILASIKERRA